MSMEANTIPKTLLKFTILIIQSLTHYLNHSHSGKEKKKNTSNVRNCLGKKQNKFQVSSLCDICLRLRSRYTLCHDQVITRSHYGKHFLRDYYIKEPWVSGWIERKEENVENTQIGPLIRYSNWDKIYVVACTCWSIQGNFLRYKYHHLAHFTCSDMTNYTQEQIYW